ncbi:LacI family DNA-binding transcriptional regulator [Brachybacterium sp. NBEC-018]|uniref:LacI family DNA-binding transcriptional regulator n=1 Tax=Brachybacterium sp. NBEC-018 TaxID=2996004 RepID=UPI002175678C|nr:LacI family DNA-binding transcriptional regulator [Brachybacterium sp. NBEC-018]UVY84043.1 LacI family DNA-binding transcriptional regulator [Brachybacterium sp. NBEC-018]
MTADPMSRRTRRGTSMMDVAAHARVSQKTVSRVVNGEPHVREEVRERVLRSIQELDFRPNAAARSLVTRRTRRIGVVALGTTLHGPTSALAALESVARADRYSLSVMRTESTDRDEIQRAVDTLLDDGAEGIVLSEPMHLEGAPLRIREDVAVLTLGARGLTARPDELVVGADEAAGGRLAAEHLLDLGHRTVHHIAGPEAWISSQLRREGWRSVLSEHDAEIPEVVHGDWSPGSGFEAMTRLLALPITPTAVFVSNDQMAIGALSALQHAGLSSPADVSIVGFDDIDVAEFLPTPLTTLRQEFAVAAHQGMNQLIAAIDGAEPRRTQDLVPLSFVHRSTTAPPRPATSR